MRVSQSIRRRIVLGGMFAWLICPGGPARAQAPKAPAPKAPATAAPKSPPKAPVKAAPKPAPKVEAAPKVPPPPPPAEDLVVTTRYVAGDKTTTSTVSMKGQRQRIDYGPDLAVLQQCGGETVVQVNDQNKRFLTVENPRGSAEPAAKNSKKGGTITYTTTVTDTSERKTLFGLTARHLKTTLTKSTTPNACDKRKERVETDGWFIDPPALACPAAPRPAVVVNADDCRDSVEYVDPVGVSAGYPLAYTATTTDDEGKTSTMTMEVTGFTKTTLADSLFSVPQGYTEVPNLVQLNALPNGTKRPGTVRTCVASVTGKPEYQVSLDDLSDALVVSLGDAGLDALRLQAQTPVDEREVQSRECDYVLTTEITEVRKPGKGVLGRISGTTQGYGAKVDFRMTAPGSKTPQLTSSERAGASTLKAAIGAAKTVSKYVTPFGMLGSTYGAMSSFAALGGGTSAPAMKQSSDPVMNTVFMLVDKATGTKPEPELVSEEAAVAGAMEQEVKAVAAFVSKKPK